MDCAEGLLHEPGDQSVHSKSQYTLDHSALTKIMFFSSSMAVRSSYCTNWRPRHPELKKSKKVPDDFMPSYMPFLVRSCARLSARRKKLNLDRKISRTPYLPYQQRSPRRFSSSSSMAGVVRSVYDWIPPVPLHPTHLSDRRQWLGYAIRRSAGWTPWEGLPADNQFELAQR